MSEVSDISPSNLDSSLCFLQLSISHDVLDEAQTGIKISERNISKLRRADVTTLITESEEELKSLLMKMKEESEKVA